MAESHYEELSLDERISQAIRDNDVKPLAQHDAYAASLLVLLDIIGRHDAQRELIESLPHVVDRLDIVDFRNILVNMGFESAHLDIKSHDLAEGLYPALFEASNGRLIVLIKSQDGEVDYFDAQSGEFVTGDIPRLKGKAYLFTENLSGDEISSDSWFSGLVHRFRRLMVYLLGMTLMINLAALMVPLFVMLVYQKVIATQSTDSLPYLVGGIMVLLVGELSLRSVRAGLIGSVAGRLDYLIGVETFRKIAYLPPINLERSSVSAQLSRIHQFDAVRDFFTGQSASVALEIPFVVIFIIAMGLLAGPIALIPVLVIVLYVIFGLLWLPGLNDKITRAGKAKTDKQALMLQTLTGRPEIKAVAAEGLWLHRFREQSAETVLANRDTHIGQGVMTIVAQSMTMLASLAILGFGSQAVVEGTLGVGALIATMALSMRVLSPLQGAFLMFSRGRHAIQAIEQINQLMRLQTESRAPQAHLMDQGLKGRVRIDHVSFRYAPDQDPALMNVSMLAEAGEMVAIIGSTASGKSTLLKMISGMYRAQGGILSLDGRDIRQLDVRELRRNIAYVPQDARFFHGSIAQNLRLNNALADENQIRAAAADAGVLDAIEALPDGFETRIGDNTTDSYPPGFLRSLSMARAFLNQAPIVLLDEPGASLDNKADQSFMEQLKRLKHRKTVIMVSHRPSHIKLADKAVLLDNGMVRFMGKPEEAIARMTKGRAS